MWTQIVKLLELQIDQDVTDEQWEEHLLMLNDWLIREYGMRLSCEELELAYNALVKEELTKADGRQLEAFPFLDTKHIGEVLAAYRRLTAENTAIQNVIRKQLHLPESQQPTVDQIDAYMEESYRLAVDQVGSGIFYEDTGNALYTWLYNKGLIEPSQTEWEAAVAEAQRAVREDLVEQKRLVRLFEGRTAKQNHDDLITPLRQRIGSLLASVSQGEGDFVKRVRQEAFRILIRQHLRAKVYDQYGFWPDEAPRPKLVDDAPKTFSHFDWVKSLKEQLPDMPIEAVLKLQKDARDRNVLDVYELTTEEIKKRPNVPKALKHAKKSR